MLTDYIDNLKWTFNRRRSVDFCFVLSGFYLSKINQRKAEKIALEIFKQIKSLPLPFEESSFWTNSSSLIFALEILDKNEFIETDLQNVLIEYDQKLISYLSSKRVFEIEDIPFYLQLLFNINRHKVGVRDNFYKVALIQSAETIISKIDQNVHLIEKCKLHHYVNSLIQLYHQTIYQEPILQCIKTYVNNIENYFSRSDNECFNITYLSNISVYPLACRIINKRPIFNWIDVVKSCLKIPICKRIEELHIDYFYFINTFLAQSRLNEDLLIREIIEKELINMTILCENNRINLSNNQNRSLLALTITSFLDQEFSSWDEFLLVPRY